MKMPVKLEEEHVAFRKEMRELGTAQRRTEKTLEAFIHSLGRGGNGNGRLHNRPSVVSPDHPGSYL